MTKKKIALIAVSAVIAAILITMAVCAIIANSKNDDSRPTSELSYWQSMIKDEVLLKDIAIAGAHDAGTKGLPYFAATQDRTTSDLLACGTRYLDLRVSYADNKLLIYHGPSKGIALAEVLSDVKLFLTEHKSETVILDFQHFEEKTDEAQKSVIALVETDLKGFLLQNDTAALDVEFIDTLTLEKARGKCIVTWGRENCLDIISKPFVFKRDNDDGGRKNCVLHSFYYGSRNKKSSSDYIKNSLPYYISRYKEIEGRRGLFVLQGQLTDGLYVFGPHFREATHTDNMNAYLDELKTDDNLQYVNIVIRDFVTPSKNCRTLQLNVAKGAVKKDCIAAFEKMIEDNTL